MKLKMGEFNLQTNLIVTTYTTLVLFGSTSCLKMGVDVPSLADLRQPVTLSCSYDSGADGLYSVKWYKDENEFFRYTPTHMPSVQSFKLPELTAEEDVCGPTRCSVRLVHLTPGASGTYTCEVSTEAPTFRTALDSANLTVMALPGENPRIEGLQSVYSVGEVLDITCISAPSDPPARLNIYLNNDEVSQESLMIIQEATEDNLSSTSARLRQLLVREHFRGEGAGELQVRCSSHVGPGEASAHTAHVTLTLAAPQPLRNQKLEWPSAAGTGNRLRASLLLASVPILLRRYF